MVLLGKWSRPTLCGDTGPSKCYPEPALKVRSPQLSQAPGGPVSIPMQPLGDCTQVETHQ